MAGSKNLGTMYYEVDVRIGALLTGQREINSALDKTDKRMQQSARTAEQAGGGFNKLARAIKAVAAAAAVRAAITQVEQYREMNERIRQTTSSVEEYEAVQARLRNSARETYRALSETQETYISTSAALKSLGYSTATALDLTDSLALGFVVSSTSAERAQSAISAYSSSMAKGKTDGVAWGTMLRAIPGLATAVADATRLAEREVRKLGASGKLTSEQINSGLVQVLPKWREQAAGMAATTLDAGRNLRNGLVAALSELDRQAGALDTLVKAMNMVGDALGRFADDSSSVATVLAGIEGAALSVAAVLAGRLTMAMYGYGVAQVQAVKSTLQKQAADRAAAQQAIASAQADLTAANAAAVKAKGDQAVALSAAARSRATVALAAAETAATAATARLTAAQAALNAVGNAGVIVMGKLRTAMAFLGGPAGVAFLAATAMYQYYQSVNEARVGSDELAQSVAELGTEMLMLQQIQIAKDIDTFSGRIDKLRANVERTAKAIEQTGDRKTLFGGLRSEELQKERAELEKLEKLDEQRKQRLVDIRLELERRAKGDPLATDPDAPVIPPSDPGDGGKSTRDQAADTLRTMQQQLEVARLNSREAAELAANFGFGTIAARELALQAEKLAAAQSLGTKATAEQRAEAEKLAVEMFEIAQQAQAVDALGGLADELQVAQMQALGQAIGGAAQSAAALAERQAILRLGPYATPEQIESARELAAQINAISEAERLRQNLLSADPAAAATDAHQRELASLIELHELELIEDQRFNELRIAAERGYDEQMRAIEEDRFRRQSAANELLMSSLDRLGQAGTDAVTGLATGAFNGEEAMRALAQAIMQDAVGALVQMGIQQVKNMIMGQTAQSAAAATAAATGSAIAAAYTTAASMVSLASYGANAVPAQAGIASTVAMTKGLAMGAGKLYGGPTQAGKLHRINENGEPEIFNDANGRQYMMANRRGEVTPAGQEGTGGGDRGVTINIHENPERAGEVQTSETDEQRIIDVWVADFASGGRTRGSIARGFGVSDVGR